MKTALLISGYLRTLKYNISNIQEKIINQLGNVDVYIHITKNENKSDKYYNNRNSKTDIEFIERHLNPVVLLQESNYLFSSNNLENNIYNSWFKYYKLNNLKKENEKALGKYDLVIKYRPDLNITGNIVFPKILDDLIYIPKESLIDENKLRTKEDPSLCDIFAFGSSESMNKYFEIYNNLQSLIPSYGTVSETLLSYYLNNNYIPYIKQDIKYSVLLSQCNTFAICGDSGSGKTTLSEILKEYFADSFMLECDRYHKWERGNKNWENITHLNPNANFISKMNKDIFDLKIGKSIYQVDYDHTTGKFTDKKEIENANNIIVCGLHCFYSDNNLYNLKIYMDTQDELKKYWKLKRDTIQRGHSKDKVIDQIRKRENDYVKYILPQKEFADIVVNFFPKSEINFDSFDSKVDIGLRIIIKKDIKINQCIDILHNNNIEYTIDSLEDRNVLEFNEFKPLKNKQHILFQKNNFYDYILIFILNATRK